MSNSILVVDDQPGVRQLLQEYLSEQGFRVNSANDASEALYTIHSQPIDLILLDVGIKTCDGYQFLTDLRRERQIPVIIISDQAGESDAVRGLELGADDYLVKPFRLRELVARIGAVLRRIGERSNRSKPLQVNEIKLDPSAHKVMVQNLPVWLTPIEFDLLALLMSSPGRVFPRDQIIESLSTSGFNGLDRTLSVHVRNLRTKIEMDPGNPQYIETIFGVGYCFRQKSA
jgi:DNA-binding response OmpR family regulator